MKLKEGNTEVRPAGFPASRICLRGCHGNVGNFKMAIGARARSHTDADWRSGCELRPPPRRASLQGRGRAGSTPVLCLREAIDSVELAAYTLTYSQGRDGAMREYLPNVLPGHLSFDRCL